MAGLTSCALVSALLFSRRLRQKEDRRNNMNYEARWRRLIGGGFVVLLATLISFAGTASAQTCEKLAGLKLVNTTITSAQPVNAGAFAPPTGSATPFKDLAPFCRVTGVIKPTADSDIKFE